MKDIYLKKKTFLHNQQSAHDMLQRVMNIMSDNYQLIIFYRYRLEPFLIYWLSGIFVTKYLEQSIIDKQYI